MYEEGKVIVITKLAVYAEKFALAPQYSLSSESLCLCYRGKKLCVTAKLTIFPSLVPKTNNFCIYTFVLPVSASTLNSDMIMVSKICLLTS